MSDDTKVVVYVLTTIVVAVALIVGSLSLGARFVSHHYDVKRCDRWGQETGRETRFADYHFWSWQCLTRSQDGRWVPIDKVWDEVPK